ncbi:MULTISPECIES: hypothetical protein [Thermomonosporaceae]|uniref:hypothetical protein n=1 Tax=Thermomonosporaceae TaxID=2012 RepID=UPI00255B0CEE|nr:MULTISPECIES: hypothetical protein [Thermomonosporaceae]MDL4772198.1 hypothetical protein [Actinomadura xylanilytica]
MKLRAAALAAGTVTAATVLLAGGATSASAASRYQTIDHNWGRIVFDTKEKDWKVCDEKADGRKVYGGFSWKSGGSYTEHRDTNGAKKGCEWGGPLDPDIKYMNLCISSYGPDDCEWRKISN